MFQVSIWDNRAPYVHEMKIQEDNLYDKGGSSGDVPVVGRHCFDKSAMKLKKTDQRSNEKSPVSDQTIGENAVVKAAL